MLLLLTYRPSYSPPFGDRSFHTRLALTALSAPESLRMARELLGTGEIPPALGALIIRKAEGNPFFVEELVQALQEIGAVRREGSRLVLAGPLHELLVPDTIQDIILARIDRLAEAPKGILQIAPVVGKDVAFALLQSIADLPDTALTAGLKQLQAGEFLYETSAFPELEYTFKHALTHDVAYDSLPLDQRRTLHARIVHAIERLYAGRLGEHVEGLAHHAARGELWERAVAYCRQAGTKAFARSANREAVASFERALSALSRLPESPETLAQAIDIRLALRSALLPLAGIRRILAYLRQAESLARSAGDQRRLAWVFTYMTTYFLFAGELREASTVSAEAMRIATEVDDFPLRVASRACRGHACREQGDYAQAIALLGEAIAALTGDLVRERFGQASPPAVYARSMMAVCHAARGEFARGVAVAREAVQIAESADLPFSLILSSVALGKTALAQGRLEEAAAALERAIHLIRTRDIPMWFPWAAATLGYAHVLSGRLAEGLVLLDQALDGAVAIHPLPLRPLSLARLVGRSAAPRGPDGGGGSHGPRGARPEPGAQRAGLRVPCPARARPGRGARSPPDLQRAGDLHRDALALADELGMRPLVAHSHLDLVGLYTRTGEDARAAEHLAMASALYRELDMSFRLARAEAAAREVA